MEDDKMEFLGNVVMSGELHCETGLQIGTEGTLQIGGIDQPVLRDPVDNRPYIPGSSIKGKLRSLLEWDTGVVENDGDVHEHTDEAALECPVCRVFGTAADAAAPVGPTRLTVRDAHLTEEGADNLRQADTDRPFTSIKHENTIDRVTAEAKPRQFERVPRNAVFGYEFVYSVYDLGDGGDTDVDYLEEVQRAMRLLEDDALGASGSRGYGSIAFEPDTKEFEIRPADGYGPDGHESIPARSITRVRSELTE